ncbi:MAG: lipocalin family protein [Thermochromatium sp.]
MRPSRKRHDAHRPQDSPKTQQHTDDLAWNAVESYRLAEDGTVATTFTFREGGADGELRRMTPTGYIVDTASNAVWGMQFIWPIKADFRTVIARQRRDYVWVMARTPQIPEAQYEEIVKHIAAWGYDVARLRRVPQHWGTEG